MVVTVSIDKAGYVFCGAFKAGTVLRSVVDINQVATRDVIAAGSNTYLTVPNLAPETTYDVYCYTTTWYGSKVNTAAGNLAKIQVETSPCSPVVIAYEHEYVHQGAGLVDFVTVKLNNPPKQHIVVSVYATVMNGNSSAVYFLQDVMFSHHYFGVSRVALPHNLGPARDDARLHKAEAAEGGAADFGHQIADRAHALSARAGIGLRRVLAA